MAGFKVVQLLSDVMVLTEPCTSLGKNGRSGRVLVGCSAPTAAAGLAEVLDSTGKWRTAPPTPANKEPPCWSAVSAG